MRLRTGFDTARARLGPQTIALIAAASLLLTGCIEFTSDSAPAGDDASSIGASNSAAGFAPAGEQIAPGTRTYVVRERDTLSRIAREHGTSLAELLTLNDVPNPSVIEPGQVIALPPLERAEVVASSPVGSGVTESVTPAGHWYDEWVDRLPALPDQLEPAKPVLLALAAVALALGGVGVVVVGVPLVYALMNALGSGLSFGSGRLQAAVAGIPRGTAQPNDGERGRGPTFGWLSRLRTSRSALALGRPRAGHAVGQPGGDAAIGGGANAVGSEPARPGLLRQAGTGATRRIRSLAVAAGRGARGGGRLAARGVHAGVEWLRLALLAVGRASMRGARAGGHVLAQQARRAGSAPRDRVHRYREERRRREFREEVERTATARMRLGLRSDAESYLERSVDASLREGWRLEAAWCLQLLAEEADRRGDHALAEIRRVRARELIRDHTLAEAEGGA